VEREKTVLPIASGGPALRGSLEIKVFGVLACSTLTNHTRRKVFPPAQPPWTSPSENTATRKRRFFDRAPTPRNGRPRSAPQAVPGFPDAPAPNSVAAMGAHADDA